jgi:hypothetical protein
VTPMTIIVRPDAVNDCLVEHGLEHGYVPVEAALMQAEGTNNGHPALLLIIEVDGKKVLAKTTLWLMESAVRAMRAASEPGGSGSL